ncbi:helix-turn-helix domain-containing protein [Marinifilum caeruleilacunae]|uniref:AraC family transcriptional regulator n=1 Tax=Marinifilum caeruleilacunae TaxID=2499076 RepID=A0ABX1WUQ2_9BACT|nr:AraC family transcriptional regulator [Marinifilum caeruleilacunae]NOU59648.1 AraC family transcriptional regulator [Marinifilum caeruleilacunae]
MTEFLHINTLTEVFKIMEMPSPKHPLIAVVDFSKSPFTKSVPQVKVVCDFYQISFKSDKNGFLKYGRETYDYQEGSMVYLEPGQVVEYDTNNDDHITSGWSLFFHADLIRTFPLGKTIKEYGFFNYQSNEALHISEKEKQIVESIIHKIEIELDSNLDDFSEELIVSNIELLLNYSKRFYNRQFITRKRFNKNTIAQFSNMLEDYFEKEFQKELGIPTVQYFANKLNFSPNYLSDLIRKGTDKSILEHIHYHVIELAKNKLLNSNNSISEIAFELGFEYSQYFSRLFKNKVGKTPLEYRRLN